MSEDFRQQVYNNLNLKETDELLAIWAKKDHEAWSDLAFEVIEEILVQRLGKLPYPEEALLELNPPEVKGVKKSIADQLIEQAPLPVFYRPRQVLWLETWLKRAAFAAVGMSIISAFFEYQTTKNIVWTYFQGMPQRELLASLIAFIIDAVSALLQCVVLYFALTSFGSVLKILMEMEFNTRGVKNTIS